MKWCHACSRAFTTDACPQCGWQALQVDGFASFAPDLAESGRGYDPSYHDQIARLEARHFWFRSRIRLIVHALRKHCAGMGAFLEIGCGTGMVLQAIHAAFPRSAVSGSELFVEGLDVARGRLPDACLMQMDATRIPYADEFDAIGAFDVLEHIEDDGRVLDEIHRALHPSGTVILTVPQHPWLWSHQDEMAHHVRRYRRGELEARLHRHGFQVLCSTSFVTLLLPLLAASRRAAKRKDEDPFHEMRMGNTLNALLYGALTLEFWLLRIGLRLPAGGSRLVVATKEAP